MRRDVAITGVGPVSAIGTGVEAFWKALVEGRSGVRALTRCAPIGRGCAVAAEVDEPAPVPLEVGHPVTRSVQLALVAARLACDDAALSGDRERIGVAVGTGVGNLDLIDQALERSRQGERIAASVAFRAFPHAASCELARELDLRGPIATITSGCNSGADVLGLALDWIRLGRADAVLVGGTEAELTPAFLSMMTAARALAIRHNLHPEAASRPFDVDRDGNVPGEGAAFLVLESMEHAAARGARIRARLCGYASRAVGRREQYDPFRPIFNPEHLIRTLRAALVDAGIAPESLSAISANGSSSVFYDVVEAAAIGELLGPRVDQTPVHSIKSTLGQTGAVTPALQAIAAALSVEHGLVPPTRNVEHQDERCPLRLVRERALEMRLDHVLINSIGFGGFYHSALVIGRR
jgi:3-oxoacyl-[acyl-carrier-protein] synthase II